MIERLGYWIGLIAALAMTFTLLQYDVIDSFTYSVLTFLTILYFAGIEDNGE
jgi:hypothetical protein